MEMSESDNFNSSSTQEQEKQLKYNPSSDSVIDSILKKNLINPEYVRSQLLIEESGSSYGGPFYFEGYFKLFDGSRLLLDFSMEGEYEACISSVDEDYIKDYDSLKMIVSLIAEKFMGDDYVEIEGSPWDSEED